jgi:LysM repeat protein
VAAAAVAASNESEPPPFEPPVVDAPAPAASADPVAAAPAPASGAAPAASAAAVSEPITPTDSASGSTYALARVAVQADLDRGELGKALVKLSEWYGDPSLTPEETQEVETLLGQLAGDVIYEGPPAHRLAEKHVVATGETLETIAQKYNVPAQLLAKINRIPDPSAVQVGQELKVMQGPFSAIVDLGKRRMTLMLDRCYAGKFNIELDPTASIEEGSWKVDQKLLTPVAGGVYGQPAGATVDRGLLITSTTTPTSQPAMLRGPGSADQVSAPPVSRVIRFKATDVEDVYDILSVGSTITIRR